ncbi:MAG TPA: inorganic diphosphatase [Solirubrobacteraceae bacterium]|nr:inorganic diphosphatase [Solirubrobacteraceae bacterium]
MPSATPENLHCLVEIPKGSRNKYEWDPELQQIKLDRFLFSSVVYPTDYGFIPQTLAQDGDPLDAMVVVSEPTFPGCMIPVKAIALFRMTDDKGQDDKVLCVPRQDPNWNELETLEDLPHQLRDEISHFFSIYKQPEGKEVTVQGWMSREEAFAEIDDAHRRWAELPDGVAR